MANHTFRNVSITLNELIALASCLNYDNRESQHSDNYSNGGHDEFKAVLSWDDKQVAALIGSMEQKGLGSGDDNDGNGHIFWLTDFGVDVIFDAIDAGIIE